MARARTRTPRAGAPAGRTTKASSRMGSGSADVEVVEDAPGLDVADGALIVTTVLLVVAFLFLDYARGSLYGEGMFF